jgi:hypothetical protein
MSIEWSAQTVSTIRAGDMTYDRLENGRLENGRLDNGRLDDGSLDDGSLDSGSLDGGSLGIAKFEDENNAPEKALSRKAAF